METLDITAKNVTNLPESPGIYKFICTPTNKYYIGGARNLKKRFKEHMTLLRNNKHPNTHLQRSFNKYGTNNFCYQIVEFTQTGDVFVREQSYLDEAFKTPKEIFNMERYSRPVGKSHVRSTKRKRIFTLEHRQKISKSLKGLIKSQQAIEKARITQIQKICKPFTLIDPDGVSHPGLCVEDFAKEHGLSVGNYTTGIRAVLAKKRKHYQGWHLPETTFPVIHNQVLQKRVIVWSINAICRNYNLDPGGLARLLHKQWSQYNGWLLTVC